MESTNILTLITALSLSIYIIGKISVWRIEKRNPDFNKGPLNIQKPENGTPPPTTEAVHQIHRKSRYKEILDSYLEKIETMTSNEESGLYLKSAKEEFNDNVYEGRRNIIQFLDMAITQLIARDIFSEHKTTLKRKYNQLIYKDDYGQITKDKWEGEAKYFSERVLLPKLSLLCGNEPKCSYSIKSGLIDSKNSIDYWIDSVTNWVEEEAEQDGIEPQPHQHTKQSTHLKQQPEFSYLMDGIEYERYIEEMVESHGWEATRTPPSGDHGADVIAEKNSVRVAIQCKKYSSPVGNKSVQEAFSAKTFYECTHAIVVTNSSFTVAAKQAAASMNVLIIHHEDIGESLDIISPPHYDHGHDKKS